MFNKYLDISTGHITKADSEWLGTYADQKHSIEGVGFPYRYDCGFFIAVCEPDENEPINCNFSNLFGNVVNYARINGCALIRLDADGPLVETLEVCDW